MAKEDHSMVFCFCKMCTLIGAEFIKDLIEGHHHGLYELLHINVGCFLQLADETNTRGLLTDSRTVRVEEQLVARFMCSLSKKEVKFEFDENCVKAFEVLRRNLIEATTWLLLSGSYHYLNPCVMQVML